MGRYVVQRGFHRQHGRAVGGVGLDGCLQPLVGIEAVGGHVDAEGLTFKAVGSCVVDFGGRSGWGGGSGATHGE